MVDEGKDLKGEPLLDPTGTPKTNGNSAADEAGRAGEGQGSPTAATAALADLPPDLPAAYEKVLGEKQELYDRLLRKQAEMENLRKRVQREREEFVQHATSDLIRSLLPVLDGFERALRQRDAGVPAAFYDGLELIHQEMLGVLGRAGVTPIATSGQLFDPHLHQAVETVKAEGRREHEIVEELQRGYKLRQRLLRPAIVKVAKGTK